MSIADTIFQQLGGGRFVAFTGAKEFNTKGNNLRFRIPRNASKANMVEITLNGLDLYDMKFTKYTPFHLNKKTFEWVEEKVVEVREFKDIYCDQLQALFTEVTGLYTHF